MVYALVGIEAAEIIRSLVGPKTAAAAAPR
jgi:hypothetical protein